MICKKSVVCIVSTRFHRHRSKLTLAFDHIIQKQEDFSFHHEPPHKWILKSTGYFSLYYFHTISNASLLLSLTTLCKRDGQKYLAVAKGLKEVSTMRGHPRARFTYPPRCKCVIYVIYIRDWTSLASLAMHAIKAGPLR